MSARSSAAIPHGRRDLAPTQAIELPAVELACPSCNHAEALQYVVPGKHYNAITATEITEGRVTYPTVETVELDAAEPDVDADDRPSGIRCTYCRWGFTGPNPVTKLVRK